MWRSLTRLSPQQEDFGKHPRSVAEEEEEEGEGVVGACFRQSDTLNVETWKPPLSPSVERFEEEV